MNDPSAGDNKPKKRAPTVISIPTVGNRIYGDDVPLLWREAARQTGITDRTFFRLLERREISHLKVGGRIMVKPSAIRKYLERQERLAL